MSLQVMTEATVVNSDAAALTPAAKRSAYLAELLAIASVARPVLSEATPGIKLVQGIQQQAAARIPELAIPSTREEDWRFTDLSRLLDQRFEGVSSLAPLTMTDIAPWILPETLRLVFVDGLYAAELSAIAPLPSGLTVSTLASAAIALPLAQTPGQEEVFTTLNTAAFADLAIVQVAKNATLEQPLHLLFITTGTNTLSHPRCLLSAEASSRLTLIEDYVVLPTSAVRPTGESAADSSATFTNTVTEILLGENAELHHTRVQRDNTAAFHIGKTVVTQARYSHYHSIAIHIGGQLARHNLEVYHQGEQVETNLYGFASVTGSQLIDTHSAILYNHPHCKSDQLYKAIVAGKGRSVFNGRVNVPKPAQLTDAAQLNRNLLLSAQGRVDTKPQLEIVADNVKCSHGATVSQLEDDEIFYLQSRGIDRQSAQELLIEAFAGEILQKLPLEALRTALHDLIIPHHA